MKIPMPKIPLRKYAIYAGLLVGLAVLAFPSYLLVQRVNRWLGDDSSGAVSGPVHPTLPTLPPPSPPPAPPTTGPSAPPPASPPSLREDSRLSAPPSPPVPAEESLAPKQVAEGVLFRYRNPQAKNVYLGGSFGGWKGDRMVRNEEGVWELVRPLKKGRHSYKFKVDGKWIVDPENPLSLQTPKGRVSLVLVR